MKEVILFYKWKLEKKYLEKFLSYFSSSSVWIENFRNLHYQICLKKLRNLQRTYVQYNKICTM